MRRSTESAEKHAIRSGEQHRPSSSFPTRQMRCGRFPSSEPIDARTTSTTVLTNQPAKFERYRRDARAPDGSVIPDRLQRVRDIDDAPNDSVGLASARAGRSLVPSRTYRHSWHRRASTVWHPVRAPRRATRLACWTVVRTVAMGLPGRTTKPSMRHGRTTAIVTLPGHDPNLTKPAKCSEIIVNWCTRLDSNQWPLPSEGSALSS